MFILILSLLSNFAIAQDKSAAACAPGQNDFSKIKELNQKLEWWSASPAQVTNAPCARRTFFTTDEMKSWIDENVKSGKKETRTVQGITIKDEDPRLIDAFARLVTRQNTIFNRNDFKQKKVVTKCDKALCAIQEVFGKKAGLQLVFMLERFGYNGSHYAFGDSSAWRSDELDHVLLSLSDYPDSYVPFEKNQRFIHFQRGYTLGEEAYGTATVADASVEVFDFWNELGAGERRSALFHEIGHRTSNAAGEIDESKEWLALSGWTKKKNPKGGENDWTASKHNCLMSKYGASNPAEDFAETMVAYRYNAKMLKKNCPEKFEFLQNTVFDGVEYTSPDSCKSQNLVSKKNKEKADALLGELATNSPAAYAKHAKMLNGIEKSCIDSLVVGILSPANKTADEDHRKCIDSALKKEACTAAAVSTLKPEYINFYQAMQSRKPGACTDTVPAGLEKNFIAVEKARLQESLVTGLMKNAESSFYNQRECDKWGQYFSSYCTGHLYLDKPSATSFDKRYGKDCYSYKGINDLAVKVCDKVKENRNIVMRTINTDFSKEEITQALKDVIK